MAEERDDQEFGGTEGRQEGQQPTGQQAQQPTGQQAQQPTGQQGQPSEFGQQQAQQPTGQQGGQPMGANDSQTGSGTPLSQGSEFGGQSSSGQTQPSRGSGGTLTSDQGPGVGTQSKSGSAGGSSSEEGFIGSQGSGSDDYLQDRGSEPSGSSSAEATEGTDFAEQGRGALEGDEEDSETGQSRSGNEDIERP